MIKEVQQAELTRMEREHMEHLIDYPILSEEIEDTIYALNATSREDEKEMFEMLSIVYNSTTSGLLYDTINKYFNMEKEESGDWEILSLKNKEGIYEPENEDDRLCESCMLEHNKQFVSTFHKTGETFCNDCLSELGEDDV